MKNPIVNPALQIDFTRLWSVPRLLILTRFHSRHNVYKTNIMQSNFMELTQKRYTSGHWGKIFHNPDHMILILFPTTCSKWILYFLSKVSHFWNPAIYIYMSFKKKHSHLKRHIKIPNKTNTSGFTTQNTFFFSKNKMLSLLKLCHNRNSHIYMSWKKHTQTKKDTWLL